MKHIHKGIIILFTLVFFLHLTSSAKATDISPDTTARTTTGYGCTEDPSNKTYCLLAPLPGIGDGTGTVKVSEGLGGYINKIIYLIMGLIGVLCVVMITVGGIEYMTTMNIGEKEGAKNRIVDALLGLLLALASYIILSTINGALVETTVGIEGSTITATDQIVFTAGSGYTSPSGLTPTSAPGIDQYNDLIKKAAAKYGVDCNLIKAVMSVEDPSGNPYARSGVGAMGLMQLMPDTFRQYGGLGSDPNNPEVNINAGTAYLADLKKHGCNGAASNSAGCNTSDIRDIAAAYNGGSGVNQQASDCPAPKTQWECEKKRGGLQETFNYANQVMTNYNNMTKNGTGCPQ